MRTVVLVLSLALQLGAQTLRIDGGAAPMQNIFRPIKAAFEKSSGIRLELRENGPEVALLALAKGEVDAAAGGMTLASWFALMAERGHPGLQPKDFQARQIGVDRINVFLNGDLVILDLDKAQLKAAFTGRVGNWKALGGPDLAIVVILGSKVPGTNKVFQEQILDGEPFAAKARVVGDASSVLAALDATPGAIGIGPQSALLGQKLTSPVTPTVGRPVFLLSRGEPGEALKQLLAFAEGEGKALTAR